MLLFLISVFLIYGCREEQEAVNNSQHLSYPSKIGYKKLSEIPEILPVIEKAKSQIQLNTNILSKGVKDFDIDTERILVMDLADNGRNISMIVNQPDIDMQIQQNRYSVINLNVIQHDGIETYFLTKYIPDNGQPFYSYSDFVGTIEVYDIDGHLISASSSTAKHLAFVVGCWGYVINDNNGYWQIGSETWVCGGVPGGSGTEGSGTGGGPGSGGSTGGTGNTGGSSPHGGDPGGNSTGNPTTDPGTSDPIGVPNIPGATAIDQKRFQIYLGSLPQNQSDFIIQSPLLTCGFSFLKANNFSAFSKSIVSWAAEYYRHDTETGISDYKPYLDFASKFLTDNPDTANPQFIFSRVDALDKFLKLNPDGLLDIPCSQLPLWQDVSKYQVPQSVKNKIKTIPNQNSYWSSWAITDLESGAGARVNMDLFPVKINSLPNKPGTNQKYTPAEFFDFFRKNINLFAEKFEPLEDNYYNIHDTALWNSSNPLGALIHIKIPLDNGTVICSGFSTNAWIFTTIKAPLAWSYDGIHPVAGNQNLVIILIQMMALSPFIQEG